MNGIHDMGGMHGFGPIMREEDEPIFHHAWEARVFGIRQVTPVPIPGGSRNNIEHMDPVSYLTSSYYEKWLHAQIQGLVDAGVLSEAELEERMAHYRHHPDAPMPQRLDPDGVQRTLTRIHALQSARLDVAITPQFSLGATVRVRNLHPPGHTRLPRYVRDKQGTVSRYYGIYDFQDAVPAGVNASPQPLYAVRFDGRELWGAAAEANHVVYLDMWESYLQPA